MSVDVERFITVRSMRDVVATRRRLIAYVWKGHGLPAGLPHVDRDVATPADLAELRCRRYDRVTAHLAHGLVSTSYLAWPRGRHPKRLAIYHTGHGNPHAAPYDRPLLDTTQALLDVGWVVAVVDLPLLGWNASQAAGNVTSHEIFAHYEKPAFSALTFFLEPLALLVNYAYAEFGEGPIAMIGLSGGGWATTVYAALDPRVTHSYPVAGSWPFFLRGLPPHKPNHGDWEQRKDALPGFYTLAGYLDLYVLGSTGTGRRQLQILNTYDPVCFPGLYHRSYAGHVRRRVAAIGGGSWDVLEDDTHTSHTVSDYARAVILDELRELVRQRSRTTGRGSAAVTKRGTASASRSSASAMTRRGTDGVATAGAEARQGGRSPAARGHSTAGSSPTSEGNS
ncbi:MAG TPA: hypothetical protein VIL34_09690 [Actinopolymorphaceae bacterium]|mgnify:CR=1 FL=1|jgi:hypothetical protein